MTDLYKYLSRGFRTLETSILLTSLALLIGLTVTQIFLRNVFSMSLSWVQPFNQHLVLVIAFVGTMIAGRKSEHISFDVLKPYFPERFRSLFNGIGAILAALVCAWLTYICAQMVYLDILDPLPAFGKVPQWVFEIFIPIGFSVIGYRLIKATFIGAK